MNQRLNFFEIQNLPDLALEYKLLSIELDRVDDNSVYSKNLQLLARKVGKEIIGPTALVYRDGNHQIAVPADKDIKTDTFPLLSGFIGKVKEQGEVHSLDFINQVSGDNYIAHQLLNFQINQQLNRNLGLWNLSSNYYFNKVPININDPSDIDVYGGFSYRLVPFRGSWHICLDLTYKYLSRCFLSETINDSNKNELLKAFQGRRFLYFYGDNWYQVQLEGFGKTNKLQKFFDKNKELQNVFDFTLANAQARKFNLKQQLKEDDVSIFYSYPNSSMERKHGASSLAKMIYSTADQDVHALHNYSINGPEKRFGQIAKSISRYFQDIKISGRPLMISEEPLEIGLKSFPIPDLKFKGNSTFGVRDLRKSDSLDLFQYGSERKKMLLKKGILNERRFGNQYLLVPHSMDRGLVDAFSESMTSTLKSLARNFTGFKIIVYKSTGTTSAYKQVNEIKKALSDNNVQEGIALLVLPDRDIDSPRTIRSIHDFLYKDKYPEIKFQSATQSRILSFFRAFPDHEKILKFKVLAHQQQRFSSYKLYLSLAYLLVNRRWPYALKEPLNYDVYIGMDIHERFVGFCYFYRNGENIVFSTRETIKRVGSYRNERISKELIIANVTDRLKRDIPKYAPDVKSIVILRDGRSFGEEDKALTQVVDKLAGEGYLNEKDFKWGVVDLHKKSSIPIRIASVNHVGRYVNPMIGTYLPDLSPNFGVVCNTGFPFKLRGTSGPLTIELAAGNLDVELVLQDIFEQSMLSFSAPDKCNSVPVTIRLIDILIQPLAYTATKEWLESEDLSSMEYQP